MKYKLQELFIPNNSIFPAAVNVDLIKATLQALETQAPMPTDIVATPVHVPAEPITVYIVLDKGVAVTFDPTGELSVLDGNHEYVVAPLASNNTEAPGQTVGVFAVNVNVKPVAIVTLAVADPVQVPVEPITVYVVAEVGLAVTDVPLAELKLAEGDHV